MQRVKIQKGFTIVELLIVVVVIAILAAITIVGYNGITKRADDSRIASNLSQDAKKIELARIASGNDTYPTDLSTLGITLVNDGNGTYGTTFGAKAYCLDMNNGDSANVITSDSSISRPGYCGTMNGLVAWLPLNGDARDISGNNLTGQVANTTAVAGVQNESNTALSFNGSSSQVLCSTSSLVRPTNTVSVTAWVYLSAAPSATVGIVNNGTQGYSLSVNTSRQLVFSAGGKTTTVGNVTMNVGQWYPVYGTYDTGRAQAGVTDITTGSGGTSGIGTIGSGTITNYGSDVCQIGSTKSTAGTYFNGKIDDVRIYNLSLIHI